VVTHFNNVYTGHFPIHDLLDNEVRVCAAVRNRSAGKEYPTYWDERASAKVREREREGGGTVQCERVGGRV
jgi:hypothetical protein